MTDASGAMSDAPPPPPEMGGFGFDRPGVDPKEVAFFHRGDDVDQGEGAHHHTLGEKRGQAASGAKLKQLQADVTEGVAALNAALAALVPPGSIQWTVATSAAAGWLICDGSAVSRATYAALFNACNPTVGTFTAATTDICTLTAHGMYTGQRVYVTSTGTIPAGLTQNADRWVIRINANTFYLATSLANAIAGTRVDITSTGSGTHTIHRTFGVGNGSTTFTLPDLKGRTVVGVDAGQAEFDALGETGGAKTHTHDLSDVAWAQVSSSTGNPVLKLRRISVPSWTPDFAVNASGVGSGTNSAEATAIPLRGATDAGNSLQPYIALNAIIKT